MRLNKQILEGDNPDITEERLQSTFDTDALAAELKGGYDKLRRSRELYAEVTKRPDLHDPCPQAYMTRDEKIDNSCRKITNLISQIPEFADPTDQSEVFQLIRDVIGLDGYPLAIHLLMFVPTIQNQCDEEQREQWLTKAMTAEIIGTYAQTEMGHGTNLSKIETVANYDKTKEEFILHSPTTTSMKWWPGGLGKSCNHAVVVANLVIEEEKFGPHNFMVQLRDIETHKPLKGVTVGDIGPKFGINALDNGFLKFDNYRIPRRNMLMKYAKVSCDGKYTKPIHAKMGYTTMVHVRTEMVMHQALYLSYCMIIAIRYSAIRRQGEITPGAGEVRILDYQTQQHRLFPHLARVFAFHYTGEEIRALFHSVQKGFQNGETELLADLHAISSGLKAVVTYQSGQGIEQARMSCGGHGYSEASYLPLIFSSAIGACTYEGENMVMLLQLARYLMKAAKIAKSGKSMGPLVEYLIQPSQKNSLIDRIPNSDYSHYFYDFEHISRKRVLSAFERLGNLRAQGLSKENAWNANAVEMTKAARAHSRMFIARAFYKRVQLINDQRVKCVLSDLLHLHLNYELIDQAENLLEDGYLSSGQLRYLKEDMYRLFAKIRPNAVSIVDSFDVPDREIRSVLGRRDGNVYENLYKWAKQSSLNKQEVLPTFEKYMKPMMNKSKL